MTDPQQEYNSLDELFRKTFDQLPETPDPSGWDTPSEQVWKHVQANIQPPQSGWTLQSIGLISAFAVALAVGLYLFFAPAKTPPAPTPVVAPSVVTPTVAPPTHEVVEIPAKPSIQPASEVAHKPSVQHSVAKPKHHEAVNTAQQQQTEGQKPPAGLLPGTKPVSPNSKLREGSEGKAKDH